MHILLLNYYANLIQELIDSFNNSPLGKILDENNVKYTDDIVKIITPGTITENTMLDEHKNNYIANIYMVGKQYALSYADISTLLGNQPQSYTIFAEEVSRRNDS